MRRKDRSAAREFLAEGRQATAEALADGAARLLLVAPDAVGQHQDLLAVAYEAGVPAVTVEATAFAQLCGTVTPQGILAVCRMVDRSLTDALGPAARLVVFCDRIRDPGNLGTVIRCADAFGADAVLVSADSVDLYNPKAVRASTGSIFHLPIAVGIEVSEAITLARAGGLAVLGADAAAPDTVDDLARTGALAAPTLWVLGNEAWGLGADHAGLPDRLVALPMYGRAESLNLATAAAVLLYASATAQRSADLSDSVVARATTESDNSAAG